MKGILNQVFTILELTLVFPQLLLFYLTTHKQIIIADVQKWVNIFEWKSSSNLVNLVKEELV